MVQASALIDDIAEQIFARLRVDFVAKRQQAGGRSADGGERGAKIVADRRQQRGFQQFGSGENAAFGNFAVEAQACERERRQLRQRAEVGGVFGRSPRGQARDRAERAVSVGQWLVVKRGPVVGRGPRQSGNGVWQAIDVPEQRCLQFGHAIELAGQNVFQIGRAARGLQVAADAQQTFEPGVGLVGAVRAVAHASRQAARNDCAKQKHGRCCKVRRGLEPELPQWLDNHEIEQGGADGSADQRDDQAGNGADDHQPDDEDQ